MAPSVKEKHSMKKTLFLALVVTLAVVVAACQTDQPTATSSTPVPSKPTVVINTPPSNSMVETGSQLQVQSTATDAEGIVLVELLVDGATVQNSPTPNGQPQSQFSVIQSWTATTPGTHTLTVKATNARLVTGEASISVTVIQQVAQATATLVVTTPVIPTATPIVPTNTPSAPPPTSAPTTCTLASTFISDVTIPDGTVIAPGGAF